MTQGRVVEYRIANVYPSGELTVHKATSMVRTARPPERKFGPRMTRGTSPRGARALRRSVVARARSVRSQFVLLTFTTREARSDEHMRRAFGNMLAWGRKYLRGVMDWYVWAAEDQQRGVLHFHLLLACRVPRPLFLRIRRLWAEEYGMGPGSVDIEAMRSAKGAAKYLAKYLSKVPNDHMVGLDPDGTLTFRRWRVSRHNGLPYARDRFRGNGYGMSAAARYGTRPTTSFWAPVGAFPGLDHWHGCVFFAESEVEAHQLLEAVVNSRDGSPRPVTVWR